MTEAERRRRRCESVKKCMNHPLHGAARRKRAAERDKLTAAARSRKYRESLKGKAARKRWSASTRGRAAQRRWNAKHYSTYRRTRVFRGEKIRAYRARYTATEKGEWIMRRARWKHRYGAWSIPFMEELYHLKKELRRLQKEKK